MGKQPRDTHVNIDSNIPGARDRAARTVPYRTKQSAASPVEGRNFSTDDVAPSVEVI